MTRVDIEIEVVYALPLAQDITRLRVPAGTTVAGAIERSAIASRHPDAQIDLKRVAVLGCLATPDTVVRDGDRIEILRPLVIDPMEARRRRTSTRRRRGAQR